MPELSKEEQILVNMDTVEVPKDKAQKYLIEHMTNKANKNELHGSKASPQKQLAATNNY